MDERVIFTRTLKICFVRKDAPDVPEYASIRDLEQLGEIAAKFDSGDYLPGQPHFTFERQLWVFTALHSGLAMRVKKDAGFIAAMQSLAETEEAIAAEKKAHKEEAAPSG